jgi:hypothetical protein
MAIFLKLRREDSGCILHTIADFFPLAANLWQRTNHD